MQHLQPRLDLPEDIAGRRLFTSQRAEGENNVWRDLSPEEKVHAYAISPLDSTRLCERLLYACLLAQSARVRALLFNFIVMLDFAAAWLLERLFEQKPDLFPIPVAPTPEFCTPLFTAKIEATIRNQVI